MCLSEMGLSCRRGASPILSAKSVYKSLMLISDNTIFGSQMEFWKLDRKFQPAFPLSGITKTIITLHLSAKFKFFLPTFPLIIVHQGLCSPKMLLTRIDCLERFSQTNYRERVTIYCFLKIRYKQVCRDLMDRKLYHHCHLFQSTDSSCIRAFCVWEQRSGSLNKLDKFFWAKTWTKNKIKPLKKAPFFSVQTWYTRPTWKITCNYFIISCSVLVVDGQ